MTGRSLPLALVGALSLSVCGGGDLGVMEGYCGDGYLSVDLPGASVVVSQSSSIVAATTTDGEGRFELELSPGAYTVNCSAVAEGCAFSEAQEVVLEGGQSAEVNLFPSSEICY